MLSFDRTADWLAAFRDHRSSTERGFATFRRSHPVLREGTKGTMYTSGEVHGGRARRLDKGTRKGWGQDPVPQPTGRPAQFRLGSAPARQIPCACTKTCLSLSQKRVSPHVLRHTAAMELLQAGVDRSLIALWLGHESVETTQIYLDADLALKEKVLAKTTPIKAKRARYRPGDQLLSSLKNL